MLVHCSTWRCRTAGLVTRYWSTFLVPLGFLWTDLGNAQRWTSMDTFVGLSCPPVAGQCPRQPVCSLVRMLRINPPDSANVRFSCQVTLAQSCWLECFCEESNDTLCCWRTTHRKPIIEPQLTDVQRIDWFSIPPFFPGLSITFPVSYAFLGNLKLNW